MKPDIPSIFQSETGLDVAENLAFFLLQKTGSIFGRYTGLLTATEQRGLLGRFTGKRKISLDGVCETINGISWAQFMLTGNDAFRSSRAACSLTPTTSLPTQDQVVKRLSRVWQTKAPASTQRIPFRQNIGLQCVYQGAVAHVRPQIRYTLPPQH